MLSFDYRAECSQKLTFLRRQTKWKITYTKRGGLYYPDLTLSEQSTENIGRFGRMRRRYLKEHRKALYSLLCMKLELNDHLREINRQAVDQIELITAQLAQAKGVNEQLKARDQLGWVQAMKATWRDRRIQAI